jgi:hypothetical protein
MVCSFPNSKVIYGRGGGLLLVLITFQMVAIGYSRPEARML